jgi:hypothetical protein
MSATDDAKLALSQSQPLPTTPDSTAPTGWEAEGVNFAPLVSGDTFTVTVFAVCSR